MNLKELQKKIIESLFEIEASHTKKAILYLQPDSLDDLKDVCDCVVVAGWFVAVHRVTDPQYKGVQRITISLKAQQGYTDNPTYIG